MTEDTSVDFVLFRIVRIVCRVKTLCPTMRSVAKDNHKGGSMHLRVLDIRPVGRVLQRDAKGTWHVSSALKVN